MFLSLKWAQMACMYRVPGRLVRHLSNITVITATV
jgi:hypothetical protein